MPVDRSTPQYSAAPCPASRHRGAEVKTADPGAGPAPCALGRRLVYRRLRLDGWSVNHKRVHRIWREEGLQRPLPRKRKRSRPAGGGRELLRSEYPHHVWAIDFQFDQTMDGRALKFLNVIDEFSRVCLAIRVGRRCKAVDVIDTIEELLKLYPPPTHLRMDNGCPTTIWLRGRAKQVDRS